MCEWGTTVEMEVTIPARFSRTGKTRRKVIGVDECIAPIVRALNDAGIATLASCCGHGKRPGNIMLADGREFIICPDFETAREAERMWPVAINGEPLERS